MTSRQSTGADPAGVANGPLRISTEGRDFIYPSVARSSVHRLLLVLDDRDIGTSTGHSPETAEAAVAGPDSVGDFATAGEDLLYVDFDKVLALHWTAGDSTSGERPPAGQKLLVDGLRSRVDDRTIGDILLSTIDAVVSSTAIGSQRLAVMERFMFGDGGRDGGLASWVDRISGWATNFAAGQVEDPPAPPASTVWSDPKNRRSSPKPDPKGAQRQALPSDSGAEGNRGAGRRGASPTPAGPTAESKRPNRRSPKTPASVASERVGSKVKPERAR